MSKKILSVIVIIVLCVVIGFMVIHNIYLGLDSKNWPSTVGHFKQGCQNFRGYAFAWERYYEYDYKIDAEEYLGRFESTSFPQAIIENFSILQEGQSITVYYNPQNHKQSTLVPGYFDIRDVIFNLVQIFVALAIIGYLVFKG